MRFPCLASILFALVACGAEQGAGPQTPEKPVQEAVASRADVDAGAADAEPSAPLSSGAIDKQVEAIKASFEAQNAHDPASVAAFYTADAVVKAPGLPDWVGRTTIKAEQEKTFEDLPDGRWGVRRILVKDEIAIVEWTSTGTLIPARPTRKSQLKRFGANGVSIMWFTPEVLIREEYDVLNAPTVTAQTKPGAKGTREVLLQPSGTPDVRTSQGTPEETKNVTLAKAMGKAFDTRDEKGFLELLSDDIAWEDYAAPAPLAGKTDVWQMFVALTKALPDMKTTCEAWGIEEMVALQCTRLASHEGALPLGALKVPATHAHLTLHFVDVLQVKGGKIAKVWHYADNMEAATQVGLVKNPNAAWTDAAKPKPKPKK